MFMIIRIGDKYFFPMNQMHFVVHNCSAYCNSTVGTVRDLTLSLNTGLSANDNIAYQKAR